MAEVFANLDENTTSRKAGQGVDPLFPRRWSPRSMTGEPVSREMLFTLFEAARWAPSGSNSQPWRFLYALRDTPTFPLFFDLLVPGNQIWCAKAGALLVFLAKTNAGRNGALSPSYAFDTGAAWENLALQGSILGLVVHAMGGFDTAKAVEVLGIPPEMAVMAMCAIGHKAPASDLPENLREREKPSDRKPLSELVFEGRFPSGN